jgi:hypothetical protein
LTGRVSIYLFVREALRIDTGMRVGNQESKVLADILSHGVAQTDTEEVVAIPHVIEVFEAALGIPGFRLMVDNTHTLEAFILTIEQGGSTDDVIDSVHEEQGEHLRGRIERKGNPTVTPMMDIFDITRIVLIPINEAVVKHIDELFDGTFHQTEVIEHTSVVEMLTLEENLNDCAMTMHRM